MAIIDIRAPCMTDEPPPSKVAGVRHAASTKELRNDRVARTEFMRDSFHVQQKQVRGTVFDDPKVR